jgi:hypothetical protein
MPVSSRPSRITETWLQHFIDNPDEVLWPEVRSMARELLKLRREAHAAAIKFHQDAFERDFYWLGG